MIKKTLLLSIIIILMLISGCSNEQELNETEINKTYLIATCPTTYEYLKQINMTDDYIIQTDSTAQALQLLNANIVQIAFVGRNIYLNEINHDTSSAELFTRHTIISKNNEPISINQLRELNILTYLSEEDVKEHVDLKIEFINKKDMQEYQNDLFLIPWLDFDEHLMRGFRLVNIYDGLNKADIFRNPTFHYYPEFEVVVKELIEKIINS